MIADCLIASDTRPAVSVVVPTLNSARTLAACLASIREQTYPRERIELIVADAGSTDGTLDIARRYEADRVVANPLRTGEAGKTEGIRAATGEIVALIDSDNVLDGADWLERMLQPFQDPDISAAEPLHYTRRSRDPALTRYFAMLGMSDPLCLFLGNYDRRSLVTGRWTDLRVDSEDCGGFLKLTLDPGNMPTLGANGFVFRKALLGHVRWTPYFFDIDVAQQAVAAGFRHMAKVKCGIVHLYCARLLDFGRKQDRRIRDYLAYARAQTRSYPWNRQRKAGLIGFVLQTLLVLPLIAQMLRGFRRRADPAWLYHVPVCWITLWIYGWAALRVRLGWQPEAKSRAMWRQ